VLIRRPIRTAEVQQIVALDHPVLRNLWITQAYHDLADGMTPVLGDDDVCWCAFATWASKTAGATIRGEELPEVVRALLDLLPSFRATMRRLNRSRNTTARRINGGVVGIVDAVVDEESEIIARGNLSVFEELGPLFARMIELCDGRRSVGSGERHAFLETVRSLDSRPEMTRSLRVAFGAYFAAMDEHVGTARAQHVLLANALIGLVEQSRLQPTIKDALDSPITHGLRAFIRDVVEDVVPIRAVDRDIDQGLFRLLPLATRMFHYLSTARLIRLRTPDAELDLDRSVPPNPDGREFPPALAKITNEQLRSFMAEYDRTGGTGRGAGAHDWTRLTERMDYIVNLFRSRQQDGHLLEEPFHPEQLEAMQAGRVPDGAL
jgi:hypothetical protein